MPVTAALAWAPSATLLLAGRVLQGLAAAFAYLAERGTPRQPTWGVALYTHESTSPAALILALATASFSSTAQELLPMNPSITALVLDNHHTVSRRAVQVNGTPATLARFERRDGRHTGLEGEHFSTVVAANGTFLGFTHISLDLAGKPLSLRERTEAITRAFLQAHTPDLLARMQIR